MSDIPVDQRPRMGAGPAPVRSQVVAREGSYSTSTRDPRGTEIGGLLASLAVLNPAVSRYVDQQVDEQRQQDDVRAKALAQQVTNPREALSGAPIEGFVPPPAVSDRFRMVFHEATAQRVAIQNKDQAIRDYNEAKLDPDFDVASFLKEHRAGAMAGLTDPAAQATIGAHYSELEALIQADTERERVVKRDQVRLTTVTQLAADTFNGALHPEQVLASYPRFAEQSRAMGFDPKQTAAVLFRQITDQSARIGGMPELFDVFYAKVENGQTLLAMNPEIAGSIQGAKQQAIAARDKQMNEAVSQDNGRVLDAIQTMIDVNPSGVTEEFLMQHFSPYGAIRTASQYAALMNAARDAERKRMAVKELLPAFGDGTLGRHDPSVQNKVIEQELGPAFDALWDPARGTQPGFGADLARRIVQAHSQSGATVPADALERYIRTTVTNLPSPSGASPRFTVAADLYRTMAANPKYRDLYFNEQVSEVMQAYVQAVDAGTDPKAAYTQAYEAVSPAAKETARKFTESPEWQKQAAKYAEKFITGSSWWPRILGGNGRPEDTRYVAAAISNEVRSYHARHPQATEDQLNEYAQKVAAERFVMDTTTNMPVEIPRSIGKHQAAAAQEALSANSERLTKAMRLEQFSDSEWKVQYVPSGTEGTMNVTVTNGVTYQRLPPVKLQDLIDQERQRKNLTDPERALVGQARDALRNGTAMPDIPKELMAKAETLKAFSPGEVKKLRETEQSAVLARLNSIPAMTFGKPPNDNLQVPASKAGKVDNRLTADVAVQFMPQVAPSPGGAGNHSGFAASLITMGEAVMLTAYDDPAKGAGKNIGMGYNLNANAANVDADLKRAMVPPERIEDVKAGRASLTPDQAKRLLMVAMPRYEKAVKAAAEETAPGLWDRMTGPQKAVMVDIAWQTGNPGQFKKAWKALSAGDMETFSQEAKVTYVDKDGVRKEDTRRNNLRASMLAGLSQWMATVNTYGGIPSSKLQAMSVASNTQ